MNRLPVSLILVLPVALVLVIGGCAADDDTADEAAETGEEEADVEDDEDDEDDEDGEEAEGEESSDEAREFFEGERITFIVPFSPGGGYDNYARLVIPYFEEALDATVEIENRPGAGGLTGVNDLAAAEGDGLTIGLIPLGAPAANVIQGAEGVRFDLEEFEYVGSLTAPDYVWVAGAHAEVETYEEVEEAGEHTFAAVGVGAPNYMAARALQEAFDLGDEVVTGYDGLSETQLGVVRGEAEGVAGPYTSLRQNVEEGDLVPLLSFAPERSDELPDTPVVSELDLDDEAEEIIDAQTESLAFLRVIALPAGVPPERVDLLRSLLAEAVEDEAVLEQAEEQQLPIDYSPGEDVEAAVPELLDPPDSYRQLIEAAAQD